MTTGLIAGACFFCRIHSSSRNNQCTTNVLISAVPHQQYCGHHYLAITAHMVLSLIMARTLFAVTGRERIYRLLTFYNILEVQTFWLPDTARIEREQTRAFTAGEYIFYVTIFKTKLKANSNKYRSKILNLTYHHHIIIMCFSEVSLHVGAYSIIYTLIVCL